MSNVFGKDILSGDNFVVCGALTPAGAVENIAPCPVRVVAASAESKTAQKYQVEKITDYATMFNGRVDHQADDGPGWSWEGYQYNHPALKDEEHMVAYESKWDCLCALLVALTKELIAEGFGPDSEVPS